MVGEVRGSGLAGQEDPSIASILSLLRGDMERK